MTYNDDEDAPSYDDLAIEIEHKSAETLELRAIIRRLSNARGIDPMDPDKPCDHRVILIPEDGGARCLLCDTPMMIEVM